MSDGANAEAGACLADVQVAEAAWQEHVAGLLRAAHQHEGPARGRLLLRAARVVRRFAPAETEEILAQAYAADPLSRQIAWLYEGMVAEAGAFEQLNARQAEIVATLPSPASQGRVALIFGIRWIMRHQNTDLGARWLEEAVRLDPENEGAFLCLTDVFGEKAGDWGAWPRSPKRPPLVPATTETRCSSSRRLGRSRGVASATWPELGRRSHV